MDLSFLTPPLLFIIAAQTTYITATTYRQKKQRRRSGELLIDTSVLIDGRIVPLARTGFLQGNLVIPRSVIGELQMLADSGDHEKRAKARQGLDVAAELEALLGTSVIILRDSNRADEGVDNRLLKLAAQHGYTLCTIDYNLNKVAVVEGIPVANINELAQGLRPLYLPGETTELALTQKGQDHHQAIGHLTDGTMVVVEDAAKYIGKAVTVEFIRGLQTAAGKMMFAKLSAKSKQPSVSKQAQPTQASAPQKPRGRRPNNNNRPKNQRDSEAALVDLANR